MQLKAVMRTTLVNKRVKDRKGRGHSSHLVKHAGETGHFTGRRNILSISNNEV